MLYISHLLEDSEMRQMVSDTGMGVESIEFSIAENLDRMEEKIRLYEQRLDYIAGEKTKRNLTLHGPFLDLNPAAFDSLVQKATLERYEQCYRAAQILDAKKIIFHSCFIPAVYFPEGWALRAADFMNRFLDNKSDDIQILMENVWDPFPQLLREAAEQIAHPGFGICLDVGHAHCYSGRSCEEWIQMLMPFIRHLHLHDNLGDADSHMGLGNGNIRSEHILALLREGTDATIECYTAADVMQTYRMCEEKKVKL